ncbi:MAG TPA: cobalt-precorrin 5A hydrolase [Desulfitobacteriaceae bacterium]|nr:cobalt-precorrin 5A hydrolase [Desulfitobacteriaceae bacterium]
MKIAIIALTKQGKKTALRLKQHLPEETDLYLHEHSKPQDPAFSFKILRELMPKLWPAYPVLIFIMAAGIVTRQVARFLESKAKDPAVLVLDDNGRFVIPLLSGHLGGANAWSRYLADLLQATPIITTATDGASLIAPDEYARRLSWKVWPLANLAGINRLLLERGYLTVWTEYTLAEKHPLKSDIKYIFLSENESEKADLIISAFPKAPETKIYLIPRSLGAGIGCRRGIAPETVLRAISQALEQVGAAREALGGIYSIDLKADEPGLSQAAEALGIPFKCFSSECIQEVNDQRNLTKSEFVKNKIGVDGVCEAAGILGTQMGELILPRLKLAGEGITIALSRRKSLSWESDPEIPFI